MGLQRVECDLATKQQQWRFLKKLGIKLPYESVIPGLGGQVHTHTRVCGQVAFTHTHGQVTSF